MSFMSATQQRESSEEKLYIVESFILFNITDCCNVCPILKSSLVFLARPSILKKNYLQRTNIHPNRHLLLGHIAVLRT